MQSGTDTIMILANNSNIKLLNKSAISEQWQLVAIYNLNAKFISEQRD